MITIHMSPGGGDVASTTATFTENYRRVLMVGRSTSPITTVSNYGGTDELAQTQRGAGDDEIS